MGSALAKATGQRVGVSCHREDYQGFPPAQPQPLNCVSGARSSPSESVNDVTRRCALTNIQRWSAAVSVWLAMQEMTSDDDGLRFTDNRWGADVLVARDGRYLMLKRGAGRYLGGQWNIPGGAVEPGETVREAARREVAEEAALDVRITDEIAHFTNADTGGRPICFHTVTFLGVESATSAPVVLSPRNTTSTAGCCPPRRCGSTGCGTKRSRGRAIPDIPRLDDTGDQHPGAKLITKTGQIQYSQIVDIWITSCKGRVR
jgi:ADP-ribose pyrophosphatase YjhB (NUDIX family)